MKPPQRLLSGAEAESLRDALAAFEADGDGRALRRLVTLTARLVLAVDDRVAILTPRHPEGKA